MIAVAVVNKTPELIDYDHFCEMIERDYQMDRQDVADIISDGFEEYQTHPELETVVNAVSQEFGPNPSKVDGVWGDAYYIAYEEIQNTQEEIRAEINALRSTSRKGNTKEDIARRLENIVSNMDGIL